MYLLLCFPKGIFCDSDRSWVLFYWTLVFLTFVEIKILFSSIERLSLAITTAR